MAIADWSTTAALNVKSTGIASASGGVSIQGTAPVSNFDDALRGIMAQLATYRDTINDSGGGSNSTWTPEINIGGGNTGITYTSRSAVYVTVSDIVYFKLSIVLSSKGALTGDVTIDTFPFTTTAVANPLHAVD